MASGRHSRFMAARKKKRKADLSLVGTTLAGRYNLVQLLGDGGMGAVYKAADTVLRRFVAIKLLHPSTAENPSAVERFVREARSAAAIGHPNIIDILDFGREGTRPYLVMEYLRGRSLSEVIGNEGRLSISRACSIATHSLAGLSAAHDRGILHRDLKPANMMLIALLGDKDFVKLCDFGFAALVKPTVRIDGGKELTPARTLVGTPAYAAPERLRGNDRRDPRIDVYSLGVVLFEMLAGRRPFDAPTFKELARKVRKEQAPSLRSIRSDVPKGLDAAVAKSLAKDAKHRFENAADFASALVPFGGRFVPLDDAPSDSFTMDLLRIRARETQQQRSVSVEEAEEILKLRREYRAEKERQKKARARHAGYASVDDLKRKPQISRPVRMTPPQPLPPEPDPHEDTAVDVPRGFIHDALGVTSKEQRPAARVFSGAVALSVIRFVSRRFGERALQRLLEELPPALQQHFSGGVSPHDWIPFDAVLQLVQRIDARLGGDDLHLVVQCGRAIAEGGFERMRRLRPPSPPAQLLLQEMPSILGDFVRGVSFRSNQIGPGFGRMEVDEHAESSLAFCVMIIGFLDRSLDRFGATDVEVTLRSTPALGDDDCVYEVTWLA